MPMVNVENRLKRKLATGQPAFCLAVTQVRVASIAMIAKSCGFDAIYIDLEHHPTSLETAAAISIAAIGLGITPIVRPSSSTAEEVARTLDAGAQGLKVSHIDTAEEARALVDACRMPPLGHRSAGGSLSALAYQKMSQAEVNETLNQETLLLAMLETPKAIENAAAIAAVPGIDVLHIGSNDLCCELGIPGQYRDPRLLEAYEKAAKACREHGKTLGCGGIWEDWELRTQLMKIGVRYFATGSDVNYLMSAARADIEGMRAIAF